MVRMRAERASQNMPLQGTAADIIIGGIIDRTSLVQSAVRILGDGHIHSLGGGLSQRRHGGRNQNHIEADGEVLLIFKNQPVAYI